MSLDRVEIQGYKSIASCKLELGSLNVLIGPNGAGKSNFIGAFGLLGSLVRDDLQLVIGQQGGAASILHGGPKRTAELNFRMEFDRNAYAAQLVPSLDGGLVFKSENAEFFGPGHAEPYESLPGSGHPESRLSRKAAEKPGGVADFVAKAMASWKVFHFHDTSPQSGAKQKQPIDDNDALRASAENIASFLFRLRETSRDHYDRIVESVRMVAPFFRDFRLQPDRLNKQMIQLEWRQVGDEGYFNANALSDGTLRFICASTLLLQPDPPSVILIDEPELGLHPFAINQLAAMFKSAAVNHQLIVTTQSVTLLNQLDVNDIVVVEQREGASTFDRPNTKDLENWLDEYSLGELWEKNVLGGRPY
jgi:predicted ATPase